MDSHVERLANGTGGDVADVPRTNGLSSRPLTGNANRRQSLTLPRIAGTQSHYQNACYYHNSPAHERMSPDLLPAEEITILYYASATVSADGTVQLQNIEVDTRWLVGPHRGYLRACLALKQRNQALKVLLSIGGDGAANFPSVASHNDSRETFARSAASLADQYGLDGIDVNWKHPQNYHEADRFVALLEQTRWKLRDGLMLTTSLPARTFDQERIHQWQRINQVVDYFNLICYDFDTLWVEGEERSNHQSQLYNDLQQYHTVRDQEASCHGAVSYLMKNSHRVHPHKILLGIPTHGISFRGATNIGQCFKGGEGVDRRFDYKDLPRPGSVEEIDPQAKAVFCYGTDDGFISYDNPQTVWFKGEYLKHNRLGGFFFSSAAGDKRGNDSLIRTGYECLRDS